MEILERYFTFIKSIVFFISLVQISYSIPPDFCFENFNRSDCKEAPQQVFSYYKPGSRCEREVWRGCPTLNKFDSQAECVHLCIFHFGKGRSVSKPTGNKKAVNAPACLNPVNVKYCNNNLTQVFIYNKFLNTCVSIIWRGCPYPDYVFENKLDCLEKCFQLDWDERVKKIPEIQIDEVEEILDNFIDTSILEKKLYEFITTSTQKYVIEIKTSEQTDGNTIWRNETENIIIDIGTTQNVESHNEIPERKKNTTIATPEMVSLESLSTIAEKITESIPTMKESTTKTTELTPKTTELIPKPTESTIETTESTTKQTESTTDASTTIIVEPATTMLEIMTSGITTIRTRGTAKQIVLPQDIDR